jgi:hypothetical protein
MVVSPRALTVVTCAAALAVFAIVQDRITAAGARQYAASQRTALRDGIAPVNVDQVMRPAIQRSVRQGLLWGAVVLAVGLGVSAGAGRSERASRKPGGGGP